MKLVRILMLLMFSLIFANSGVNAQPFSFTAFTAGPHKVTHYKLASIGPVKVVGRKLMVDFDGNGIYVPYFIKGVGYQPMPISRHPSDWGWPDPDPRPDNIYDDTAILNRDCPLLQ